MGRGGGRMETVTSAKPRGVSLIQTRTPENILEQMDSFHNHQAKGWVKQMLQHTGWGDAHNAGTS